MIKLTRLTLEETKQKLINEYEAQTGEPAPSGENFKNILNACSEMLFDQQEYYFNLFDDSVVSEDQAVS